MVTLTLATQKMAKGEYINPVIITIVVIALVVVSVVAYFFLMIFFPEWVGITGPEAKKALKEHQDGSESSDLDFFRK